jgi:hypothetical protein
MKFKINRVYEAPCVELHMSVYEGEVEVQKYLFWYDSIKVFSIDGIEWYTLHYDNLHVKLSEPIQQALKLHVNQEIEEGNLLELNVYAS